MAYRRRYGRRPARRYSRRYTGYQRRRRRTGVLSKRNIYKNKSAHSQAKQIARLVTRVARIPRPEPVQKFISFSKVWSNQDFTTSYLTFQFSPGLQILNHQDGLGVQSGNLNNTFPGIQGNTMRFLGATMKFNFSYKDNRQYVSGTSLGSLYATYRVIILQAKSSRGTNPIGFTPDAYIDGYSSTGMEYRLNHLFPFRPGTASDVRVVYDKGYGLNLYKPNKIVKIKIPRTSFEKMDSNTISKGSFFGFVLVNNLEWPGSEGTSYIQNVRLDGYIKFAYTDV